MTTDSQFALRRIMETYSKITRFCIICNYINKIMSTVMSKHTEKNALTVIQEYFQNNTGKFEFKI